MKAGFIGLGTLGTAIARRLLDEGVELVVWNRTPQRVERVPSAAVAASPAELISQVPLVVINVRDSAAVEDVLAGDQGLLRGECAGRVIVDTTTNHPADVTRFHELVRARGATYVEAPVLGSVAPASQGALTVLVSATPDAYAQARPILEKLDSAIFFLEQPGLATRMKLINNLALGVFNAVLAEALALGEAAGLEKARVLAILEAGAGKSGTLAAKKQKWLDEDFSTTFSAAMIYKDLHYLQDLAYALGRPLFTGSAVKELYALAVARGHGDEDFSVLYEVFKEVEG